MAFRRNSEKKGICDEIKLKNNGVCGGQNTVIDEKFNVPKTRDADCPVRKGFIFESSFLNDVIVISLLLFMMSSPCLFTSMVSRLVGNVSTVWL